MASMIDTFSGVFTALVTPFNDGGIDFAAYDRLIENQLAAGIKGLVPAGTTGEAATLERGEAASLVRHTVERVGGRAFVLAGAGSNNTRHAVEAARMCEDAGADGCLVVTPYYNKPSQNGLVLHYDAIAAATRPPGSSA